MISKLPLATANVPLADFDQALEKCGLSGLQRSRVTTLQVNVGRLCNLACHHCHVEAGPKRTEIMDTAVTNRLLELLTASPEVEVVDLTGGAPEMNPNFRHLVAESRRLGRRVIDRCNLTILLEDGFEELGYGRRDSPLRLDLVFNPQGPSLPPDQADLERDYKRHLGELFGLEFHHLLTITNMPIGRFAEQLARHDRMAAYQTLLVDHFNPGTVGGLMCRSQVSVDWDGTLYDCDFNLMLRLPLPSDNEANRRSIFDIETLDSLDGGAIATATHCFGCTAGSGSSCGGSLS
jgi:MoaA/NifB/PqqE/SkfB family radical SAM enzyme